MRPPGRSCARADQYARATHPRLAALASKGRLTRLARRGALIAAALALMACARTSRLASTWTDPGFRDSSLTRLLVVAVGRSPGERRRFEDRFVATLRARGVDARASYPFIGDARADSALVDAQARQTGCDGIFVSRVVDRQTVRRNYGSALGPLGYYGPPSRYHAGWWPYYAFGYASATGGAFAVEDQRVSVETNLYRHVDGQLVWSGLSRQWLTADDGPGAETASVVRELVEELAQSGVVRRSAALTAARGAALRPAP
jgi:hypothetical protein